VSELRNRLERLAARGRRRGADDVLGAALRGAPRDEIGIVPDFEGTDLPIIDDDIVPFVTAEPETRRRSRYGTVVAAFGIAALLGVGMLAVTAVFGNGGASSPEGAVRQLADAISHKDPLAAVDVLSPTEVRSARQTISDATHRAADLKIVDSASQPLAGVDLSVDHLELSTQTLADGYAKVTITGGEISASTHAAAMSKLLQSAMKSSDSSTRGTVDLARLASNSNLPTFVVTVRHDGRWYVSPAYTALEYARESSGGPPAEFGSAAAKVATLGSDTPDNAVGDALHAWQAGNWDRLMALAPPDELPVYDYRNWIDQAAADTHPDFTIDKLSTTSTVSGDAATVKLEASGTTGSGSDKGTWQVGGTCPTNTFGANWRTSSSNGGGAYSTSSGAQQYTSSLCLAGNLDEAVPFGLFVGDTGTSTQSSGSISIQVVRENGRWFVSPVTTVLDALDSAIQHVDQRTVYTLLGLAYQLPPDGNITLNQPFTVPSERGFWHSSVFAFEGAKGQKVIGESSGNNYGASGEVYTADGKQVDYVDFSPKGSGFGFPTALPESGSYRLVINGSVPKGGMLTLWDAKDAPKGLIAPNGGIGSGGGGFSQSCSGNGVSTSCTSTPITIPVSPATRSGSANASACTVTNNTLSCAGEGSRSVTATSSPAPSPTSGVATSVP
jgi:hypothetical protein